MNILLVNNDEAVTRLVKLSTEKTGDSLDVAASVNDVEEKSYDLLILDNTLYSRELLEYLNDRIVYAHSMLITTRESQEIGLFEKQLYKPFLPTELLLMLHKIAAQVDSEQAALSKEIAFDAFEDTYFSEEEIVGGDDASEQDALERVQQFEKVDEEPLKEIGADEASEEEVLDNIFSKEEVSEVQAILDVLGEESADKESQTETISEKADADQEIDEELEAALRNLSEEELSQSMDDAMLMQLEDISTEGLSWNGEQPSGSKSSRHQESVETLRTLLRALEDPQLSKSLRGTITINLTFGEDNES
jgi:uncharacterized membrane protein